jgi:alpha-glucosidase
VNIDNQVSYQLHYQDKPLLMPSAIELLLAKDHIVSKPLTARKAEIKSIRDSIISPIPEKRKIIRDEYTELTIQFRQPLSLQFRVYNDGVAYRWMSQFKDSIIIEQELAEFNFPAITGLFSAVQKRGDRTFITRVLSLTS